MAPAPARAPRPATPGTPISTPLVSWVRLGVATAAGLLGFLWAGVLPLAGAWELRAVVCALIIGLVVRGSRGDPRQGPRLMLERDALRHPPHLCTQAPHKRRLLGFEPAPLILRVDE